ncbi:MAG: hypothetical protein ACW9W9_04295 [Candidatus Nitrosopumilus sp. Bin_571-38]
MHKAEPVSNKIRYEIGQKRCTFCGIFFLLDDIRCICCKAVLRTKPRSRKSK